MIGSTDCRPTKQFAPNTHGIAAYSDSPTCGHGNSLNFLENGAQAVALAGDISETLSTDVLFEVHLILSRFLVEGCDFLKCKSALDRHAHLVRELRLEFQFRRVVGRWLLRSKHKRAQPSPAEASRNFRRRAVALSPSIATSSSAHRDLW